MHIIIMAAVLFCPAAQAQIASADPEAVELRREVSEHSSNAQAMMQSLAKGLENDDAAALRKKLNMLKEARASMGEEAGLRMEIVQELLTLQLAAGSMGNVYELDADGLRMRLANVKKLESALGASLDKKEYQAFKDKRDSGRLKGLLSALRSAIQVYYGDNEGVFPPDLAALTVKGKYLSEIYPVNLPGHKKASAAVKLVSGVKNMDELAEKVDDAGGWLYVNDKASPLWGTVVFNCRHNDLNDEKKPLMYTY